MASLQKAKPLLSFRSNSPLHSPICESPNDTDRGSRGSNTAGFGVGRDAAFPARLEAILRANGTDVQLINAGVSGDTTGGMLARLDNVVPAGAGVVIVQGGYNDLRRGGNPASIGTNIEAILSRLRTRQVRMVLCGFYNESWEAIARRHGAVFVPSSTCYDAAHRGFDGLHMNASGHEVVASRLLPVVQRLTVPTKGKARPRRS